MTFNNGVDDQVACEVPQFVVSLFKTRSVAENAVPYLVAYNSCCFVNLDGIDEVLTIVNVSSVGRHCLYIFRMGKFEHEQ